MQPYPFYTKNLHCN